MASAERAEVAAVAKESECALRENGEAAKATQDSASRVGLRDLTNVSGGLGRVRKRSTSSMGQRDKKTQLSSDLRGFFYESKVHSLDDDVRKDEGTLALVEAAKEEGEEDWQDAVSDGPGEGVEGDNAHEAYTRLFTAQNEHHGSRTSRRTQSQYEVFPSRKRLSLDGEEKPWDDGLERKRSCAIALLANNSTVNVEPEDDEVFEDSENQQQSHLLLHQTSSLSMSTSMLEREGSPIGDVLVHHRANFERTLSASVLERGEFASPLRGQPRLPNLPNIVYSLPLVPSKECQVHSVAFGCISAVTLAAEMQSLGLDDFHRKYVLIDCRYPYEYEGGHIKNAINLHDNAGLPSLFFPPESILDGVSDVSPSASLSSLEAALLEDEVPPPRRRIPVFYCEYSQKRGPTMAHDLRSIDRRLNMDRYPDVDYEVMYLLERGYRNFFTTFSQSNAELFSTHCGYVEMKHEKKELGKFKAHRKRARARVMLPPRATAESPLTPAASKKGGRASLADRERSRETLMSRLGGARARLNFDDSEDEEKPLKKKEEEGGLKETHL